MAVEVTQAHRTDDEADGDTVQPEAFYPGGFAIVKVSWRDALLRRPF